MSGTQVGNGASWHAHEWIDMHDSFQTESPRSCLSHANATIIIAQLLLIRGPSKSKSKLTLRRVLL